MQRDSQADIQDPVQNTKMKQNNKPNTTEDNTNPKKPKKTEENKKTKQNKKTKKIKPTSPRAIAPNSFHKDPERAKHRTERAKQSTELQNSFQKVPERGVYKAEYRVHSACKAEHRA